LSEAQTAQLKQTAKECAGNSVGASEQEEKSRFQYLVMILE
jgi:hypothetical protein